jgi:3-dehydroquinate synthase
MGDSAVSSDLEINSYKGTYSVSFYDSLLSDVTLFLGEDRHYLVDSNIAKLYPKQLSPILQHQNTILIDATEENKSLNNIIPIFERLVSQKIRRSHKLLAIGGGVVQDITCFIASTLLRGVPWEFIPTTLLSQADSCIGSKSSINLSNAKNILGTFNPPDKIFICIDFLDSLHKRDILSGMGEILKVHAIDSSVAFDMLAKNYDKAIANQNVLLDYIGGALRIKKAYIEIDEFDCGPRLIFNYGHSFGHAIESATNYAIPHGIAVSMGMDMANRIATLRNLLPEREYLRMHSTLSKNYDDFRNFNIPLDKMVNALLKDKKNTTKNLVLILPVGSDSLISRVEVAPDKPFLTQCKIFLDEMRV